uniref:Hydrogenase-1 operon protein n=1 Tax=Candidatus Methylacidiphilum infernorum TaxID=511746 RepID=A0A1W5LCV2_9BACT|nr:hydrogenase-1 operon protein [Candidatus Methylacidiphilum infernorum]
MRDLLEKIYLSFLEERDGKRVVQVPFCGNRGSELLSYLLEGGEVEMHFGRNSGRVVFESKIPGLWATWQSGELKCLEVGELPTLLLEVQGDLPLIPSFNLGELSTTRPGLMNGPYILVEISRIAREHDFTPHPRVIPLNFLPLSLADQKLLDEKLGHGELTICIKGYGQCWIKNTPYRNIWWVEHLNVEGKSIFKSIEITSIPSLIRTAREDMERGLSKIEKLMEKLDHEIPI